MNLCDFLMGMNLTGGSGGGGGDPETKAIVDNAVENHGIGTVYTETILAPVTVAPGDWDANNKYTLTGVALDLVLGETYPVTVNGTTYDVEAVDAGGKIGLGLMDLGIAITAGSEGPPATDPYIFAFQGAPAESMTFSIVKKTINGIDKIFQWDAVFFLDIENYAGQVIKGSQAEVFAKLTSDLPVVSVLAIAKIADDSVVSGFRCVQCGVDMFPNLSSQDVSFTFWTGTQEEESYWVWDADGFLQAD